MEETMDPFLLLCRYELIQFLWDVTIVVFEMVLIKVFRDIHEVEIMPVNVVY